MTMKKILIHLPDTLLRRLKRRIPRRPRSAFIQRLLEQAPPSDESEGNLLYQTALEVEHDERLTAEMSDWDATIDDHAGPEAGTAPPALFDRRWRLLQSGGEW